MASYYAYEKNLRIERKNILARFAPKSYFWMIINQVVKIAIADVKADAAKSYHGVSMPVHICIRVYIRIGETHDEIHYRKAGRYLFTINKL